MLDIGWQELAITGVVALVVLGPKELPGLMRMAGQLTRRAKAVAHEFRMSLEEITEHEELDEFRRSAWHKADAQEKALDMDPSLKPKTEQATAVLKPEDKSDDKPLQS